MKLHRIEVENLNSLVGKQEVDLLARFERASLLVILGPTGAGKSTLMDAVCLALFGTTPRLLSIKAANDVADQIMSRGTSHCTAALEFSRAVGGHPSALPRRMVGRAQGAEGRAPRPAGAGCAAGAPPVG